MILIPISGCLFTRSRNAVRDRRAVTTGLAATTLAERGLPSSNASSPKKVPGPRRFTVRPAEPLTMRATPSSSTKKASPRVPSVMMVRPAPKRTIFDRSPTALRCRCDRPANSGIGASRRTPSRPSAPDGCPSGTVRAVCTADAPETVRRTAIKGPYPR